MKKIILILITIIVAIGSLIVYLTNQSPKNDDITIGYSQLRISLPVFVAKEQGLFKKNGLSVVLKKYDTAQPLVQALLEGKINIGGYSALPISFNGILNTETDLYFSTLMIEDQDNRISYLIKKKGSSLKNISDLKEKTIGILPTTAYKLWLKEILRKNGITPSEVVVKPIAPAQQLLALKTGGVDALFTNDPAATAILESEVGSMLSEEVDCPKHILSPFPFGSFNARKEWINNNEKKYKAILKSLDEAIDFINKNPQKSKEYLKLYMPEKFKKYALKYPNSKYIKSYDVQNTLIDDVERKYFDIGIIKKKHNFKGLLKNNDYR